jgi:hypothetical protein
MSKSQQKRKFATLGNSFRLRDYQEPDRVCQNFPHSEHANNAIGEYKISREWAWTVGARHRGRVRCRAAARKQRARALTVAAARSRPLRKRSPALLPLATVPKRRSREPNHNPVSNQVPRPFPACIFTGPRLPRARPPRSIKQPVQECWRPKFLPGRSPVLNRRR